MADQVHPLEAVIAQIAATLLNAAKTGHIHGSANPRLVADAYPDDWAPTVAIVRMIIDREAVAPVVRMEDVNVCEHLAGVIDPHTAAAVFTHAILARDVDVLINPGTPGDTRFRTMPAGTRVLCTVVSRFGDIGIRDTRVDSLTHGYIRRVFPNALRDVRLLEGCHG